MRLDKLDRGDRAENSAPFKPSHGLPSNTALHHRPQSPHRAPSHFLSLPTSPSQFWAMGHLADPAVTVPHDQDLSPQVNMLPSFNPLLKCEPLREAY